MVGVCATAAVAAAATAVYAYTSNKYLLGCTIPIVNDDVYANT